MNSNVGMLCAGFLSHRSPIGHRDRWHVSPSSQDPRRFQGFIWWNHNIKEHRPEAEEGVKGRWEWVWGEGTKCDMRMKWKFNVTLHRREGENQRRKVSEGKKSKLGRERGELKELNNTTPVVFFLRKVFERFWKRFKMSCFDTRLQNFGRHFYRL